MFLLYVQLTPTSPIARVEDVFDTISCLFSDACLRQGTDHSNLIDLFDHPKIEQHEGYHKIKVSDIDFDADYNLVEKKKEIKSILEKIDYQNRDLLIYRSLTRRGYYGHADYIDIFEQGEKS